MTFGDGLSLQVYFFLVMICLLNLCFSQLLGVRYTVELIFSKKLFDQLLSILLIYYLRFKVKMILGFLLGLWLWLKMNLMAGFDVLG